jgi:hypothetical protein
MRQAAEPLQNQEAPQHRSLQPYPQQCSSTPAPGPACAAAQAPSILLPRRPALGRPAAESPCHGHLAADAASQGGALLGHAPQARHEILRDLWGRGVPQAIQKCMRA